MEATQSCHDFTHHTAGSFYLRCLLSACENCGLNSTELMTQSQLHPDQINDPEYRFNLLELKSLWGNILIEANDPSIGLKIGHNMPAGQWGLVEMMAKNASCLDEAFRLALKYWKLVTDTGKMFSLERSSGLVSLRFKSAYFDFPVANEADMVYLTRQIKILLGADIKPITIQLTHSKHDLVSESEYSLYLGAPVEFNQSHNAIVIADEIFRKPIAGSQSKLKLVAEQLATEKIKQLSNAMKLSDKINAYLHQGFISLSDVANELNLGERTLQRKLKKEGKSFKSLLDDYRRNQSYQLMQEGSYSIQQISFILGYKDERTFYDSVRRWYSSTPTEAARKIRKDNR